MRLDTRTRRATLLPMLAATLLSCELVLDPVTTDTDDNLAIRGGLLGEVEAQAELGYRFMLAAVTEEDPSAWVEALKWNRLAAENGHLEAQFRVAGTYERG